MDLIQSSDYDDLRAGLAKQEYDLAFVHPAHVAMAEVKSGHKSLTPRQQALIDEGWPLVVIRSVEEAERLLE